MSLPDSIRERVEYFASQEGLSTNDFLTTVITQRVAVAEVDSYIRRRGSKGSAERMLEKLKRVPDI